MAEMNPGSCTVVAMLSGTTSLFTLYHCYMFDGLRCLIPSRRHWHRCMLVYMLVLSSLGMFIWATAWGTVKYELGWMMLPAPYGARPWPSVMFPARFKSYNRPLTIIMSIAYSAQASLNVEESLYWFHLMRSVRSPHLAKPWIGSNPFYAWVVVSVALTGLQIGMPWAFYQPGTLEKQLIAQAMTGGIIEIIVVLCATVIVWRFPAFLKHVRSSGAGPNVLSRLQFYHEANKMRTFFRYIFSVGVFVTGADGLRDQPLIGLNPVALDILTTALTFAFNLVLMISVMVALPRQYGPAGSKVMVGYVHKENDGAKTAGRRSSNPFRRLGANGQGAGDVPAGTASQFALMTLLREGGQWEGEADVLRDVHDTTSPSRAAHDIEGRSRGDERDTRFDGDRIATNDSRAGLIQNTKAWEGDEPHTQLPPALQNFTSHIAPPEASREASGPVKIRVKVEQEVHED